MKLNVTQNLEVNSFISSENKTLKTSSNNCAEAANNFKENEGSTSKLSEFNNSTAQTKQLLLLKTPAFVTPTAQTTGFGTEATVTNVDGKTVIDAGAGDDKIGVTQDSKTGDVTIEVNGKTQTFTGKDKDNLVIKAGDGNDTVAIGKGVTVKLTIEGGDGDDKLQGGDGDDTISGGKGNDKIEAGAGDDTVDGGDGRDYINGNRRRVLC